MDFQSFAGVNITGNEFNKNTQSINFVFIKFWIRSTKTGNLDPETMQLMSLPRCGVKDKVGFGSDSRSKRYALQGSRWKVKNLTYRISKYPKKLNRPEVDKEIARAFAVWSEYTDLTFTAKRTNPVHIEIRFEENEHGDGDPFDGPGGTLAHAYFPVYGGDAHFDDAEYWTIGSSRGTNLFQVAAHEFGHSLGLSHSDVRSALMAPFYRGFDPVFRLDSDDIQVSGGLFSHFSPIFWHCKGSKWDNAHTFIQGIQALYGRKTTTGFDSDSGSQPRPAFPRPSRPTEDNELCSDPKVDAMFNTADGNTYAFKGSNYYKLTESAVAEGYVSSSPENLMSIIGIAGVNPYISLEIAQTNFRRMARTPWRHRCRIHLQKW